jgi:hypothetical protein
MVQNGVHKTPKRLHFEEYYCFKTIKLCCIQILHDILKTKLCHKTMTFYWNSGKNALVVGLVFDFADIVLTNTKPNRELY